MDHGSVSSAADGPAEVGEFLKARRAELTPRDVGLPEGDEEHRRVAGLRREEVAALAAISVDYYTRLEQGRVAASSAVLATLVRALRLDDTQQTYLYTLAGKAPTRPRRRAGQRVRPAMRRLLDQLTEAPALVLGRRLDVLAWNRMASALYTDFDALPADRRNYVRLVFTDPIVRGMHVDWEQAARSGVAVLRMEAADDPQDAALAALVGELAVQDNDFRTWWATHHVTDASNGVKRYQHPVVGELTLDCDMWASPDGSNQRLMVLTAEPGSPSHEGLRILSSWHARTAPEAASGT